jgi:sec-independent protein translocase protein TatC
MELLSNLQTSTGFINAKKRLIELRNLVFKMFLAWLVGLIIAYYFQTPIYDLYINPLKSNNLTLSFLSPTDSIMFYIKIYSISGLLISLPFQIFVFWQYVKDALQVSERAVVRNYFWFGSVISVVAVIYGWLVMIPSVFKFLVGVTLPQTQLLLTSSEYSNFIIGMLLMLIATFQIPLVVSTLIRTGIVSKKQITDKRREIYVSILIITALFGSPDVFTWLLSTLPVIFLFELSVLVSNFKTS